MIFNNLISKQIKFKIIFKIKKITKINFNFLLQIKIKINIIQEYL